MGWVSKRENESERFEEAKKEKKVGKSKFPIVKSESNNEPKDSEKITIELRSENKRLIKDLENEKSRNFVETSLLKNEILKIIEEKKQVEIQLQKLIDEKKSSILLRENNLLKNQNKELTNENCKLTVELREQYILGVEKCKNKYEDWVEKLKTENKTVIAENVSLKSENSQLQHSKKCSEEQKAETENIIARLNNLSKDKQNNSFSKNEILRRLSQISLASTSNPKKNVICVFCSNLIEQEIIKVHEKKCVEYFKPSRIPLLKCKFCGGFFNESEFSIHQSQNCTGSKR